jgi:two-component system, OmpR family, phosphate regulon sensor histidine kinase PhoR
MKFANWGWPKSPRLAGWLAAGICVAVAMLAWFGWSASREWRRSSVQLVERRVDESARLLVTALAHDMRAVQASVLSSPAWNEFSFASPQAVTLLVASAFARYPYPEVFLVSESGEPLDKLAFFTRADRPPSWVTNFDEPNRYPVRMVMDSAIAESVLAQVKQDAAVGWPYSIFELQLGDATYQIVVRLHYSDAVRQHLVNVSGFMVNSDWVHEFYFSELTKQIGQVTGGDPRLVLAIVDDQGQDVVRTRAFVESDLVRRHPFPVAFFDPALVAVNPPKHFVLRKWTALASGAADPVLAAADVIVFVIAVAAVALVIGLVMTARAVRAGAELAEMRAEFMSSVTHELKTPIGSIRALGETLSSGRLPNSAAQREYGALVVQEAKRLTRLVDNVLAHARITDIADVYSFAPTHVDVIVDAALSGFTNQLRQARFAVSVDIPPGLPPIHADQAAMELVLDNLVDNAIRYSEATKELKITAVQREEMVSITVSDRGSGIAEDDLDRVTQKFVRGRNAIAGGNGLGLAIAKRIVIEHRGRLAIQSVLHEGTTVAVDIPIAADTERRSSGNQFLRRVSA